MNKDINDYIETEMNINDPLITGDEYDNDDISIYEDLF